MKSVTINFTWSPKQSFIDLSTWIVVENSFWKISIRNLTMRLLSSFVNLFFLSVFVTFFGHHLQYWDVKKYKTSILCHKVYLLCFFNISTNDDFIIFLQCQWNWKIIIYGFSLNNIIDQDFAILAGWTLKCYFIDRKALI